MTQFSLLVLNFPSNITMVFSAGWYQLTAHEDNLQLISCTFPSCSSSNASCSFVLLKHAKWKYFPCGAQVSSLWKFTESVIRKKNRSVVRRTSIKFLQNPQYVYLTEKIWKKSSNTQYKKKSNEGYVMGVTENRKSLSQTVWFIIQTGK